jgi:hypothetical protein
MSHTIELLETIGRDASLRHASAEELSQVLTGLQASEALRQAAISGDESHLATELGHRDTRSPNHPNNNVGAGHDGDDDQDGSHQSGGGADDSDTEGVGQSG